MNKAQRRLLRLASRSLIVSGTITILGSSSPVFAQRSENIIFTTQKIKTIPGHDMSKAEYPFDEEGFYKKEWVTTTARSKVSSSTTVHLPIPITSEEHSNYNAKMRIKQAEEAKKQIGGEVREKVDSFTDAPPQAEPETEVQPIPVVARLMTDAEALSGGFIGPYSKMQRQPPPQHQSVVSASSALSLSSVSSSTISTFTTLYHKVSSGDTLYAISRKYGVSVDALKKANGLTSDLIRVGQSLRLALAQHALGAPQM